MAGRVDSDPSPKEGPAAAVRRPALSCRKAAQDLTGQVRPLFLVVARIGHQWTGGSCENLVKDTDQHAPPSRPRSRIQTKWSGIMVSTSSCSRLPSPNTWRRNWYRYQQEGIVQARQKAAQEAGRKVRHDVESFVAVLIQPQGTQSKRPISTRGTKCCWAVSAYQFGLLLT